MSIKTIKEFQVDHLPVAVYQNTDDLGRAAALEARAIINNALALKDSANIILASANSQLGFLRTLRTLDDVDWSKVNVFHMDEFLGIDPNHRASFPLFLRKHFLNYLEVSSFFPISGDATKAEQICQSYEALLKEYPADLVVLGFGENGHIAFNDPPYAKFDDPVWVKVVELDEVSRQQQFYEGHFDSLAETSTHAITLTVPALLAAKHMLCIVPEARKAEAVEACLYGPITEDRPGSILRTVKHAKLFLDKDSAQKLLGSLSVNL